MCVVMCIGFFAACSSADGGNSGVGDGGGSSAKTDLAANPTWKSSDGASVGDYTTPSDYPLVADDKFKEAFTEITDTSNIAPRTYDSFIELFGQEGYWLENCPTAEGWQTVEESRMFAWKSESYYITVQFNQEKKNEPWKYYMYSSSGISIWDVREDD